MDESTHRFIGENEVHAFLHRHLLTHVNIIVHRLLRSRDVETKWHMGINTAS